MEGLLMMTLNKKDSYDDMEQTVERLQNHAWLGDPVQRMGELHAVIATLWDEVKAKRKSGIWQPIETASKDNLWSDGTHRHGKTIVAYEPRSGRILTCHWWETDIGGRHASNFLDDGGNAVFPSKWINIEPPEESDD
jgi:hypothetical protein